MLRIAAAIACASLLSGCALILEEGALAEAGAGLAAGGAEVEFGAAARGVAGEPVLISDEMSASFRSVRFTSGLRGPLSESLAELTANGQRSAILEIDRGGGISGNGYTVAHLSQRTGLIFSPRGMRLGFVSRQGLLMEYLRSGQIRPLGVVKGFVRPVQSALFADATLGRAMGQIPANGIVRIVRIGEGGYFVQLESGAEGWVPTAAIAIVAILALDQRIYVCGAQPGAIVTKSNHLVRYERCRKTATGVDLVSNGEIIHIPADAISEIWEGSVGQPVNPAFRIAAIHSLRTDGLIYPSPAEYNLYPEGDPRSRGARTPGMTEAPQ